MLNEVLMDPDIDGEYEKLLIARTLQAQAEIAEKKKDNNSYSDRIYRMYQYFPQLIPYSGLTMNMHLSTSGNAPKDFMERLKACNINWTNNTSVPAPQAYLSFSGTGKKMKVDYYVVDESGNTIVARQSLPIKTAETAVLLAYRLFNVGGKDAPVETGNERSSL